jgi:putative addiction module component (TIGR02574 family)
VSDTLQSLTKRVMQLPVAEQIELAEHIFESVVPDDDYEKSWAEELDRRWKSYKNGTEPTFDADEVMADVRARLKSNR